MKNLSLWWKEKGCHGDDNGNGTTATFRFRYSIEIPKQRGKCAERDKQGWWGDLGYRVPTCGWQGKRGVTCIDNSSTEQARASHTSHMHSFTGSRLGVIPSKRASGTVLVQCKVEEVAVLTTSVVEVVVLARSRVGGRGSRDLGDRSGTCLSLHKFP